MAVQLGIHCEYLKGLCPRSQWIMFTGIGLYTLLSINLVTTFIFRYIDTVMTGGRFPRLQRKRKYTKNMKLH